MNSIQQFLSSLPPALICLVIGTSVAAESGLTVGMILPGTTARCCSGSSPTRRSCRCRRR